jgi:hypothetical protein
MSRHAEIFHPEIGYWNPPTSSALLISNKSAWVFFCPHVNEIWGRLSLARSYLSSTPISSTPINHSNTSRWPRSPKEKVSCETAQHLNACVCFDYLKYDSLLGATLGQKILLFRSENGPCICHVEVLPLSIGLQAFHEGYD